MNRVGIGFDDAMKLIKSRREIADPIPAFIAQAKEYEETCKKLGLIKKCNKDDDDGGGGGGGKVSSSSSSRSKKRPIGPSLPNAATLKESGIDHGGNEGSADIKTRDEENTRSKKKQKGEVKKKTSIIGPSLPPQVHL